MTILDFLALLTELGFYVVAFGIAVYSVGAVVHGLSNLIDRRW